ncbi:hepcidin-like [Centropristis striata]|uniref:hepcidin-like n=1 Tax=Centropristis striata TaxID=184440 RepID=UPI0027E10A5F|nr:hepcidin-like [Centropristis striata]XP_059194834.1 hepcidin-like [Centropristis striata]XP_059194835.1 hepcidin-like [Centropristis striata]XP_059194837.1 hepcidin-like [Centropristis striata]XP_059194838.1 hepcidin-like [Centropristis striata]XP_059194840.1 hepcidin-like [Centropristis striata]XP_059194841.1 hepcidin-like [Centropristis striata]
MKTFSVAVAVAVMLAFICVQESSAVPITGVQEPEELMSNDNPAAEQEEMTEEWKMPLNFRQKRSRGMKCTPYCYPTRDGVMCGVRCDF